MTEILQFALIGLGIGGVYALLALGVVIIYRGAGVLNLAQGAMAMVGGYLFVDFRGHMADGLAVASATAATAVIGVLVHLLVMRPLREATALVRLIATLGVLTVLQQAALLRYGARPEIVEPFLPNGAVSPVGSLTVGRDRLVIFGIAAVVTCLLTVVYKRTLFGKVTTAVVENQTLAAAKGWSPDRIAGINWAAGAGLAGLAGCLLAPLASLQPGATSLTVLPALAAGLLGGFASFPLTGLGAMAIGITESEMARYVSTPGAARSLPFIVIAVILMITGRSLPIRGFQFARLPSVDPGRLRRRTIVALAAVAAALGWFALSTTWLDALTTMLTTAVVLLSVVVLTGYAGQLSLAQFATAGLGALIAGRLVAASGWPFEAALVVGVVGTVPIGLALALPALRTRGVNLAVITLGLGLAIWLVIFNNSDYTGGQDGTQVGEQTLFGIDIDATVHPDRYFVFVTVSLAVAMIAVVNLRRDRMGRSLVALRSNERAAAALGINVVATKLYAFAVASAIAALGGILIGFRGRSIVYTQFDPFASIEAVLLAVIGSVGFVVGPLIGMTMVVGGVSSMIRDLLSSIDKYIGLASGILVLVVLITQPDGAVSVGSRLVASFKRHRADAPADGEQRRRVEQRSPRPAAAAAELGVRSENRRPLVVTDLGVRFGGVTALDGVSCRVDPGEVVGLIGPNGAGKTTFVDCVSGFVGPSTGSVRFGDDDIGSWSVHRRARSGLRRSFQDASLFDELSVRENLLVAEESHEVLSAVTAVVRPSPGELSGLAREVIESLDLDSLLECLPGELSHGARRRVEIARAVVGRPSVLLLDEPAAGLGRHERTELRTVIRTLAVDRGIGVLLIEHDVSLVLESCDRIVVLDFGQVIADGTPAEIRNDATVSRAYLGDALEPAVAEHGAVAT